MAIGDHGPFREVITGGETPQVLIEHDGRPVAVADICNLGSIVQLQFSVNSGHLPAHARRQLVEAIFDRHHLLNGHSLRASVPLGDVDLLAGLAAHCTDFHTRAAGTTCLVEATVATPEAIPPADSGISGYG
jgi:hypothetical protein